MSAEHARKTFQQALDILDASEPAIREIIESELFDCTGPNSTKRNMTKKAVKQAMARITAVRTHHVKQAFRHLRANLPHV
jgi:hypothetical protein